MYRFHEPVQFGKLGCISDEMVCDAEEENSVQCNYFVSKPGFTELEEVLFRFQASLSPGSDLNLAFNDRKQRRMVSNRESARRSRLRKKRHLENLKTELNHFKAQNEELKNQFGALDWLNRTVQWENDKLKEESLVLLSRLANLRSIQGRNLMFR